MSSPTSPGVDMAREALAAARAAAKKSGVRPPSRTRTAAAPARPGRDPVGLAGVWDQLVAERGWAIPAAGGTLMDLWSRTVPPEIAENLVPAGFDPTTGRLDIEPASSAWATQARLITPVLIRQANRVAGAHAVRTVRVLPPGSHSSLDQTSTSDNPRPSPRGEPAKPAPPSAGYLKARAALATKPAGRSQGPIRTREDGGSGYQSARRALLQHRNPPHRRAP